MAEEKFVLVSLKEDEAKRLAQVISNDTSRMILDFLAGRKDATETEIAKHLTLPLSTVHYNLSGLMQAKLVQADEFHYSQKGKEVNHYCLANKYVIIAPKDAPEGLREKLRRILPVALVCTAAAAAVQLLWRAPERVMAPLPEAAPMLLQKTVADEAAAAGAESVATQNVAEHIAAAQPWFAANYALWFLYGAMFTILVFIAVDWIHRRK
jgi:DNA-binding transcriptional ArsR family regulator